MTKISAQPLKPYTEKDIMNEFWHNLNELNLEELRCFFQEVFTPTEQMMIAKRLAILRALKQGIDYESIRREYQVTNSTISKLKNALMKADEDFLKILEKLLKAEKKRWEQFLEKRKKAGGYKASKMVFARKL